MGRDDFLRILYHLLRLNGTAVQQAENGATRRHLDGRNLFAAGGTAPFRAGPGPGAHAPPADRLSPGDNWRPYPLQIRFFSDGCCLDAGAVPFRHAVPFSEIASPVFYNDIRIGFLAAQLDPNGMSAFDGGTVVIGRPALSAQTVPGLCAA